MSGIASGRTAEGTSPREVLYRAPQCRIGLRIAVENGSILDERVTCNGHKRIG
jgi:hypothetical protein